MMPYKIFVETAPGQTRVGFFDRAGVIQHVWLCRDDQPDLIGAVHQARIEQVFANQNRAQGRLADDTQISIKLPKNPPSDIAPGAIIVVTIVASPRLFFDYDCYSDDDLVCLSNSTKTPLAC